MKTARKLKWRVRRAIGRRNARREAKHLRRDAVGVCYVLDKEKRRIGDAVPITLHLEGWELVGNANWYNGMSSEVDVYGSRLETDTGVVVAEQPMGPRSTDHVTLGKRDSVDLRWRCAVNHKVNVK